MGLLALLIGAPLIAALLPLAGRRTRLPGSLVYGLVVPIVLIGTARLVSQRSLGDGSDLDPQIVFFSAGVISLGGAIIGAGASLLLFRRRV
jgi:hypothetical protein